MYREQKWFLSGVVSLLIVLIFLGWMDQAACQEKYPSKAIDIIVPAGPGGSSDLVSRLIGAYLKNKWGVPVNAINKPGGMSIPGNLEVYNAAPDGCTLLANSPPSSSIQPIVAKDLPYKVMDRTFIVVVCSSPVVIFVPPTSPIKSMKDLEAEVKGNPGTFTWTSTGTSGNDYIMRKFLKEIGVDVLKTKPIVVSGAGPAMTMTAGGNVKVGLGSMTGAFSGIKSGLVRAVAVTSATRYPDLPDVPTTGELGYPTVCFEFWNGFSGPPKVPSSIVDLWNKTSQEMLKDPDLISKLRNIGAMPFYRNASAFRELVAKETEEMAVVWR